MGKLIRVSESCAQPPSTTAKEPSRVAEGERQIDQDVARNRHSQKLHII